MYMYIALLIHSKSRLFGCYVELTLLDDLACWCFFLILLSAPHSRQKFTFSVIHSREFNSTVDVKFMAILSPFTREGTCMHQKALISKSRVVLK